MVTDRITARLQTITTTPTIAVMVSCAVESTDGFTDCDDGPSNEMVLELGLTKFDDVVTTGATVMLFTYLHMASKKTIRSNVCLCLKFTVQRKNATHRVSTNLLESRCVKPVNYSGSWYRN